MCHNEQAKLNTKNIFLPIRWKLFFFCISLENKPIDCVSNTHAATLLKNLYGITIEKYKIVSIYLFIIVLTLHRNLQKLIIYSSKIYNLTTMPYLVFIVNFLNIYWSPLQSPLIIPKLIIYNFLHFRTNSPKTRSSVSIALV